MRTEEIIKTKLDSDYKSDLSTIAKILVNGIIRLHTKKQREANTEKTQEFINDYSSNPKLIKTSGLPPLKEQQYSTRES